MASSRMVSASATRQAQPGGLERITVKNREQDPSDWGRSVSTLAPLFAAAFATHNSHDAFLVGLAASVGAGISMGLR